MLGFRTDFNYLNGLDFGDYKKYATLPNTGADIYHFTGGAEFTVLRQKVIAGLQFTYGKSANQKQVANFSNPVEYNAIDKIPLQGVLQHTVEMHYYSISLYLSAVLNFGGNKGNEADGKK